VALVLGDVAGKGVAGALLMGRLVCGWVESEVRNRQWFFDVVGTFRASDGKRT
jgi:hypothetical protein